ncbi:MAG: 3-deoxy-7-phosphoheptulonate synthase, partial [Bacteroidetes bacterium]|nr:3-deoxy-7-phosphoheptulonate synthase [Bacteroidota bacterium]
VGNCAENFSDCNGPKIHNFLRIFLQMAMVLEFKSKKRVIKIGRIAGQYAKPHSSDFEIVEGEKIPSYRGDIVNDFNKTLEQRTPNPNRLLEGYFRSASTLNLIRAFIQGGYNDISNIKDWESHFFSKEISGLDYYKKFAKDVTMSLDKGANKNFKSDQIYISHEALLLDYEEIFTRFDTTRGGYYDTSAHFLWIGDRTRQIDSAHIEFISGLGSPVGLKVGPIFEMDEIIAVLKKVNPENKDGKVVLICRMGCKEILNKLPVLIKKIKSENINTTFICDPMHGNTYCHGDIKVRDFEDIVKEITLFFEICKNENTIPGGLHLEITEENVTECTGGINKLKLSDLNKNYVSKVDPRLNAAQAL